MRYMQIFYVHGPDCDAYSLLANTVPLRTSHPALVSPGCVPCDVLHAWLTHGHRPVTDVRPNAVFSKADPLLALADMSIQAVTVTTVEAVSGEKS